MKVGLVTGPSTPSARHAPRTKVVLPVPELAGDQHDVPGGERAGELRAGGLGLLCALRDQPKRSIWLAGSGSGCTGRGCSGSGSASSGGSRLKSSRSCSSTAVPRRAAAG